jgi:PAS domain S-box-containing protein
MNLLFFTQIRKSFSAKVMACFLGAMILITGTFTFFILHSQQSYLRNEIIKDGKMLAAISANNVRLGIFAKDTRLVADSLTNSIGMEGVVGACVYDESGQLLYRETKPAWDNATICLKDEAIPPDFLDRVKKSSQVLHVDTKKTMDFWSPVQAGPQKFTEDVLFFADGDNHQSAGTRIIGVVGVVFDKDPLEKSVREIVIKNILMLLFFLSVGCIAAYHLIQGVTRPLNRLVANINPKDGVAVDTRDELGMLSDTFSGMVATLGESFDTITSLKDGLEKKVRELESEVARRRQSESDLRESEEKFRSISENIADGVAIVSDGRFVWVNKAFRVIFGFLPDELPGRDAEDLLPEIRAVQQRMGGMEEHARYLVESRRNDERIIVEVNARRVVFAKQDALQVIVRDITETVEAEKKRQELEVRALGQSKLASIGKIATSVAHEINQPLSYIKIAEESILRDLENQQLDLEETKEYCMESLRQVDRITAITDHLRSFGRTDTTQFADVRLPDVLKNSLILMGESLRLANITLVQEIEDNFPFINGSSVKLEQVFINLIQNSVDAMADRGDKKIMIAMRRAGDMVEMSLADTGPGISPDVLEHIFEPFFTTKRLEDRTGLGLGIVNNIIKEHQGTIEYRQQEGWGASFVIMLPKSKE